MYQKEIRCPYCNKLLGKLNASEYSLAKVYKVEPPNKPKELVINNKCTRCNKIVYITLSFVDQ